jgi:bis(5'-nucleosyl)-tetraphosphatase (symmetrical)
MRGRDIVIGDVHGCLEELDELLKLVEYRTGVDNLFFVGDMVDRGPDSVGCVRRTKEFRARVAMGNHDEKYVRYAKHEKNNAGTGKKNPIQLGPEKQAVWESLRPEDIEYMASWPLTIKVFDRLMMVHAGFEPHIPVAKQNPNACLRVRFVGENDGLFKASKPGFRPPESKEWSIVWTGPENVVYGHIVHDLWHPRIDHPKDGVTCYGIDTGCCFGGVMTAMIIKDQQLGPNPEFVRVRARAKYAKWLGQGEG